PEPSWAPIDRLVYFVLFPALLVRELAQAELTGLPVVRMAVVLVTTQVLMALGARLLRQQLSLSGPTYTSILQCLVRWNTYVALALAPSVVPPGATPLVALAVAVMVPVANLMSVVALARHGSAGPTDAWSLLRAVVTNPLILACLVGLALNLSGLRLPDIVVEPLAILGRATLTLGLLTVGAGLRPAHALGRAGLVGLTALTHLVLRPALGVGLALLLGLRGAPVEVVALAAAVPTATSSYILARLLGGDAELMAALVTVTTVAALATLPLVLTAAAALAG
ncbi:MAG: AEC family transporter, partial [Geminicoccaceae bacterium]